MSELQKYTCCPGTEDTYLATDVDARLALMQKQMTEMREMHAVSIADAEDRLALAQRAVEFLYSLPEMLVTKDGKRYLLHCATEVERPSWVEVPADLAAIIKPESSNGTV